MSLLFRIERHLRRTNTAPTAFGRRVVNDPRLIGDLRAGRQVGPSIVERIERALKEGA